MYVYLLPPLSLSLSLMAPTLRAFASVHQTHRLVFSKMMDKNMEVTLAKKIIALFIYLQQLDFGFKHLFDYISSLETNDPYLWQVIAWAHNLLSSLVSLPLVFTVWYPSDNPYYVWVISCERESLYRGLYEGLYGTYKGLFDDILEERGLSVKKLNPNAKEWCPNVDLEEESRFLFITFSKGLPLSCCQIRFFFTSWFGPYVETVYVHKRNGESPKFGKIVFKFSFVPYLILSGREHVEFVISGRTLRCKKYLRRIKPDS